MHQSLDMWHTALLETHAAKKAPKERLHLWRTAKGCDCFETFGGQRRIRPINGHVCSGCVRIFQGVLQEKRAKAYDNDRLLKSSALGNHETLTNVEA